MFVDLLEAFFFSLLLGTQFLHYVSCIGPNVVITDQERVGVRYDNLTLPCQFRGLPTAVYWKKGPTLPSSITMIVLYRGNQTGPGYDSGRFLIDQQYSLIIKNVSFSDGGTYYCYVSNDRGIIISNQTAVKVVALPPKPFPEIAISSDTCIQLNLSSTACLQTIRPGSHVNLTCQVNGIKPAVEVVWYANNQTLPDQHSVTSRNPDTTEDVTTVVDVIVITEQVHYMCVARGGPLEEDLEEVVILPTHKHEGETTGGRKLFTLIVCATFVTTIIVFILIFCVILAYRYRYRHRVDSRRGQPEDSPTENPEQTALMLGEVRDDELYTLSQYFGHYKQWTGLQEALGVSLAELGKVKRSKTKAHAALLAWKAKTDKTKQRKELLAVLKARDEWKKIARDFQGGNVGFSEDPKKPKTGPLSDEELSTISAKIPHSQLRELGEKCNFWWPRIAYYGTKNTPSLPGTSGTEGTCALLKVWRDKTHEKRQRDELYNILKELNILEATELVKLGKSRAKSSHGTAIPDPLTDDELEELSQNIDADSLSELGQKLDFCLPRITKYKGEYLLSKHHGTEKMLKTWRDKTHYSQQRTKLSQILQEMGNTDLADRVTNGPTKKKGHSGKRAKRPENESAV